MAKKVENKKPYTAEEREELQKLFRHVGPFYQEQMDLIWNSLKKYKDPNYPKPLVGCNCPRGYGAAFNELRDFYSANADKFE